MKTDDRLENVGGIRGRAYVMFGGKVALGTFNDGERFGDMPFQRHKNGLLSKSMSRV